MSALDSSPDEHPYIPLLEETLASAEVFVSQEAQDALEKDYDAEANKGVLQKIVPNPAPSAYAQINKVGRHADTPRRVAIISNHVPQELFDAVEILKASAVQIDIIGEQGTVREVTPELIADYDCVITIGKTVQYCMMSSTPVYVYDRFGGFGYLANENFEKCAYANFSGRGGESKNGEEIAAEIIEGYPRACAYSDAMRSIWIETYGMEYVLTDLFSQLEPHTSISFPYAGYVSALLMQMRFAWRYYRSWDFELWMRGQNIDLEDKLRAEQGKVEEQMKENARLRDKISTLNESLRQAHKETARNATQLRQVYGSHSYRLGNAIMAPLSILKKHGR